MHGKAQSGLDDDQDLLPFSPSLPSFLKCMVLRIEPSLLLSNTPLLRCLGCLANQFFFFF